MMARSLTNRRWGSPPAVANRIRARTEAGPSIRQPSPALRRPEKARWRHQVATSLGSACQTVLSPRKASSSDR